jgi:hypothetical protein
MIWLQKLDAWFASQNMYRISSFVAKEKILPAGPPAILVPTNTAEMEVIIDDTTNLTSVIKAAHPQFICQTHY